LRRTDIEVGALRERLRRFKDRVPDQRRVDGGSKLARAQKNAAAEALRREYQRQDVRHRK
jgi:hypothetical protein